MCVAELYRKDISINPSSEGDTHRILNPVTCQALCTKIKVENCVAQSPHSTHKIRHMSKLKTSHPAPDPSFVPDE